MNYTPLLIAVLLVLTVNVTISACIWTNIADIRRVLYIIRREIKNKEVKK